MSRSRHLLAYEWTGQKRPDTIKVLDIPGFQELEDRIQRATLDQLSYSDGDQLSKQTFGLTHVDTLFWQYEQQDTLSPLERIDYERNRDKHEAQFRTANVDDVARVEILDSLGLDFTDRFGRPLKCTRLFCRQAEMAIRKRGWTPANLRKSAENWGSRIEQEAKSFSDMKRRSSKSQQG